jgi:signal transduction histidine kinase
MGAGRGGHHRLLPALVPSPTDPADPPGGRDLLRAVAAGTATVTGEAFFRSLTRHLAAAFDADVAFVAELLGEPADRGRVLAISHNGADLREGYEFAIEGTPCALVLEDDVVSFPEGTCARFPHDEFTVRHGLDAYLAVAMRGSAGDHIGYIGVQSTRRLEPDADERAALAIFGARAAAEIERRRHEVALRAREAEVAASRVRIVEAADEERRRIGRNLYDGAQQRLVALGHLLAMAERRLAEGPDAAAPLLDQAREQSVLAADELRELVRGLHPAGLAEHGLSHAWPRWPPARQCRCTSTRCPRAASPRSVARCASTARPARAPAWRRRSRWRRGAPRASRSWSSATRTTAGSASAC